VERLRVIVTGYVQGVGYRYWAAREARFFGITGWVRNLPDGSVEVVAEGPKPALLELLGTLRRGPSYADVEMVAPSFSPATGEFRDFQTR
jgi:acylphosphatase